MDSGRSPLSSHDSVDARRVRTARDRLLAGREPFPGDVRPVVLESWRRSIACGVDPGTAAAPIVRFAEDPVDAEARSTLRAAAAPVLRFVGQILGDQSFVLLLTDRTCRTIDVLGPKSVLDECERINAVPGSEWAEDRVGTDAVALSTRLEEPIQIHWSENYAAVGERWTGNSAPVHDPESGELLGAISIYGFEAIAHPKALEVNTSAALMIEQRLRLAEQRRRLQLFESYSEHLSHNANGPALCMNRHGIVVALSPAASTLLQISSHEAKGRKVLDLPGLLVRGPAKPFAEISAACDLEIVRGEDRLSAALLPVVRSSQVAGFILQLEEATRRPSAKPASERDSLLEALRNANGNLADAAAALGIHRVTLYRKLKRHRIHRDYR